MTTKTGKPVATDTPLFVEAAGDHLLGLMTAPTAEPNGLLAVQLWGTGSAPTSGRNGFRTRLARNLAGLGYHVFRFDYRGIGESTGERPAPTFDGPYLTETRAVMAALPKGEHAGTVLVSNCLGTRGALALAPEVPDLAGVILMRPPPLDLNHAEAATWSRPVSSYARSAAKGSTFRRLLRRSSRRRLLKIARAKLGSITGRRKKTSDGTAVPPVSPRFMDPVVKILERGVPILIVYPANDPSFYPLFRGTLGGPLGKALDRHRHLVTIETTTGADLFASVDNQEQLLQIVDAWMAGLAEKRRTK